MPVARIRHSGELLEAVSNPVHAALENIEFCTSYNCVEVDVQTSPCITPLAQRLGPA